MNTQDLIKKCSCCKLDFPKTHEFFFKKTIKQKNASDKIAIYNSFRSVCKKCHAAKMKMNQRLKRCGEMGCDLVSYEENWKKQYSKTRTLNPEISHLPNGTITSIRKRIRKGYTYTTYEQYKLDCRKNISKAKRKYDYGNIDFVPTSEINKMRIQSLTDSYVALSLGISVYDDVSKSVFETRKLIIRLKRELKDKGIKIK
jgi:hypothetical protein